MNLLLISNSTSPAGYLTHALQPIAGFAAGIDSAVFVPYAAVIRPWDDYEARVAKALEPIGIGVTSLHRAADPVAALRAAKLVLVGGGNTFHLLHHCRRTGVLAALRDAVPRGLRFAGWSAGANLAGPTISTTNDMPVIDPQGFDALGFVPFQLNPHYTNAKLPGHFGESRDERLAEFMALNPGVEVLALPEGGWLEIAGDVRSIGGRQPALLMRHGRQTVSLPVGTWASTTR